MSHTLHTISTAVGLVLPPSPLPSDGSIQIFTDPPASVPPKLRDFGAKVFGFVKAVTLIIGVIMCGFASIKIAMGKSQRHNMAADGLQHWVYIVGAVGGVFMALPIVSFFANQ